MNFNFATKNAFIHEVIVRLCRTDAAQRACRRRALSRRCRCGSAEAAPPLQRHRRGTAGFSEVAWKWLKPDLENTAGHGGAGAPAAHKGGVTNCITSSDSRRSCQKNVRWIPEVFKFLFLNWQESVGKIGLRLYLKTVSLRELCRVRGLTWNYFRCIYLILNVKARRLVLTPTHSEKPTRDGTVDTRSQRLLVGKAGCPPWSVSALSHN